MTALSVPTALSLLASWLILGAPGGVSLFAAEEFTGLERPFSREGLDEFAVNEWYPYSLQFGFMIGSAGPWIGGGEGSDAGE